MVVSHFFSILTSDTLMVGGDYESQDIRDLKSGEWTVWVAAILPWLPLFLESSVMLLRKTFLLITACVIKFILFPHVALFVLKAFCETLEETNYRFQKELLEKQKEVESLKKLLSEKQLHIDTLESRIRCVWCFLFRLIQRVILWAKCPLCLNMI